MRRLACLATAVLLSACATGQQPAGAPAAASEPAPITRPPTEKQFADAVIAPLADLNLVRVAIPPVLVVAQKAPYALPGDASCTGLLAEVDALDDILGPDLDAEDDEASLLDRGKQAATEALIGAVRNATEGVIPFRGWVRRLTGAERHARGVAAAIKAGTLRRAYLKGLGQSAGCPPPAAPLRVWDGTAE